MLLDPAPEFDAEVWEECFDPRKFDDDSFSSSGSISTASDRRICVRSGYNAQLLVKRAESVLPLTFA